MVGNYLQNELWSEGRLQEITNQTFAQNTSRGALGKTKRGRNTFGNIIVTTAPGRRRNVESQAAKVLRSQKKKYTPKN